MVIVLRFVDLEQVVREGDFGMQVLEDARNAAVGELLHAVGQVGGDERPVAPALPAVDDSAANPLARNQAAGMAGWSRPLRPVVRG